ncbi:MAG TPA: glycosyltransferase [Pyrinomonadaceae bacterium]|nr:glycosyltransferase [Pyrinomonadaceae bacterium]
MSQELPFFSIIVPTYERPAQLEICLRALARLDYPLERFEVLIVDDGSANPPGDIVERFRGLLDVRLFSQKNTGPAGARNFGATHARGQFLAFTDDDCEPDAGWLRGFASHLAVTPDRIIGGRTLNALQHNPYSQTSHAIIEVVYAHFNADPTDARFFASNNFALSAERFREMKGFDETFITSEDREICARWRSRGLRLAYAPEAVLYHAHHLTLRTLWQQHFGYGRGALRFHRAHAADGGGRFKPDLSFYFKLLRSPASHARKIGAVQLTALLLWTQVANAAGFFYEKYQSERD